jgi:hypothetical protein
LEEHTADHRAAELERALATSTDQRPRSAEPFASV